MDLGLSGLRAVVTGGSSGIGLAAARVFLAAGAKVAMDLVDEEYGGRGYSCLDPEGHLWNFGSYDPWAAS